MKTTMEKLLQEQSDLVTEIYISEIGGEDTNAEYFSAVFQTPQGAIILNEEDLEFLLSEIKKCKKDSDYYFDTYLKD